MRWDAVRQHRGRVVGSGVRTRSDDYCTHDASARHWLQQCRLTAGVGGLARLQRRRVMRKLLLLLLLLLLGVALVLDVLSAVHCRSALGNTGRAVSRLMGLRLSLLPVRVNCRRRTTAPNGLRALVVAGHLGEPTATVLLLLLRLLMGLAWVRLLTRAVAVGIRLRCRLVLLPRVRAVPRSRHLRGVRVLRRLRHLAHLHAVLLALRLLLLLLLRLL